MFFFLLLHYSPRKRPPSYAHDCSGELCDEEEMSECNAAMILVTLSLSPKSPKNGGIFYFRHTLFTIVIASYFVKVFFGFV